MVRHTPNGLALRRNGLVVTDMFGKGVVLPPVEAGLEDGLQAGRPGGGADYAEVEREEREARTCYESETQVRECGQPLLPDRCRTELHHCT